MLTALLVATLTQTSYDPMAIKAGTKFQVRYENWLDEKRQRTIPVKLYLPSGTGKSPVILFSHGLGGNRDGSTFLGEHWAKRGYVAVFLQHPGSDESVWKDVPRLQRMSAMKRAASFQNLRLRLEDVHFAIDHLVKISETSLKGRVFVDRFGMAGHSFGAATTQGVSGQDLALLGVQFRHPKIVAAIPMSPNVQNGSSASRQFSTVRIPWLCMTGTHDDSPINNTKASDRMKVYPALPKGDKYQLVLDGAEHSVFTENRLPGERASRNPAHHPDILALSIAFWDAYLKTDPKAKAWLKGTGPKSILDAKDLWETK